MNNRLWMGLALTAGFGFALLAPASSSAAFHRVSAGACTAVGDNWRLSDLDSSHLLSAFDGYAVSGNDSLNIVCPIVDNSTFLKTNIERINVHTFDGTSSGNNYGRTWVCGQSAFTADFACLQSEDASGQGHMTLGLSTSQEIGWITALPRIDYFASLHVLLVSSSNAEQRFKGYWITD